MFNLDDTSASAGCSMAISILNNVERSVDLNMHTKLSIPVPSDFIERFCSRLEIPMETTCLAKFIAKKIETAGLLPDNNTPQSVAAGIIFYLIRLCGLVVDKLNIREVCGVSEVTINKCSKKIENIEESVVPQIILTKYRGNSAALTISPEKKK
jgi:transcription initiation factor TFIIIB Brf1 subunit/transcription initiation factor TFIIB